MVVSRRKGKARQVPPSVPLENNSSGVVISEDKVVEPMSDVQPNSRERKRKNLGPTPKPVTIPIDKFNKASPKKPSNGKITSSKGRGTKSRGIPAQSFGDNP